MEHLLKLNQTVVVNGVIHSAGETVVIDNDQRARYLLDTGAGIKVEKSIPVTVNVKGENVTVETQTLKRKKV